ncbi:hypothetical protein VY732_27580 [Pseudomonas sp. ZY71]|jgi:hypothetical protein|uniref:hypothetical protein n=1 Tax=Pseudomonas sp. ZY71 TaxID=3115647 RepID=UPI002F41BA2D
MIIGTTEIQVTLLKEGEYATVLDKDKAIKKLVLGIDKEEKAYILAEEKKPNQPKAYPFGEVVFGVAIKFRDNPFGAPPQTLPLLIP